MHALCMAAKIAGTTEGHVSYAYVRQSQLQVDVLCSFRKALHNFGKIFDQDFVPALEVREVPGVRTNRKQLPPCDHP